MIDENAVIQAIMGLDVPPAAKEEGLALVDAWTAEALPYDLQHRVIGVEAGWWWRIEPKTIVVGAIDRLAQDDLGAFPQEHKTTKNRTRYWNSDSWFNEIQRGHQVATYAGGVKYGRFIKPEIEERFAPLRAGYDGRVLVRAISKSKPPEFWPHPAGAFVTVDEKRIQATRNAYVNAAAGQRAMRASGQVPWQLPGYICTKFMKYPCPHTKVCHEYRQPPTQAWRAISLSPGSQSVVAHLVRLGEIDVDRDKDLVILSSSTLGDWMDCSEKWRQGSLGGGDESNENLDLGTVMHAAIGEIYSQVLKGQGEK